MFVFQTNGWVINQSYVNDHLSLFFIREVYLKLPSYIPSNYLLKVLKQWVNSYLLRRHILTFQYCFNLYLLYLSNLLGIFTKLHSLLCSFQHCRTEEVICLPCIHFFQTCTCKSKVYWIYGTYSDEPFGISNLNFQEIHTTFL